MIPSPKQSFSTFILFIVINSVSLFLVDASDSEKIGWFDMSSNRTFGAKMQPAGMVNGRVLYLCRGQNENRWIPGKLFIGLDNQVSCMIAERAGHSRSGNFVRFVRFQIFQSPVGTTSWVPTSYQNLPANAILGGTFPDGEAAVVCRGFFEGNTDVITGAYSQKSGKCYFEAGGGEISKDTFEVLTVNSYGIARGLRALVK